MTQFFVQEYEGRPCDISLIPWINHRGLISAFMHCLYNPSEEEFRSWIAAAERETWKHIPAIKSHIAEEVTLDRCVQRLRKRLVAESWEKRRTNSTSNKMGERVPSFFTSPSLVNLSGMNVADQSNIESFEQQRVFSANSVLAKNETPLNPVSIQQGWGGLGLSGNKSSVSLERSPSTASGLFIEGEEPVNTEQHAGEQTVPLTINRPISTSSLEGRAGDSYLKTTTMAHFYYRNSSSSQGNLKKSLSGDRDLDKLEPSHARQKSQSYSDMAKMS
jgi:hypothetical protein